MNQNTTQKKILIAGATGYLGKHAVMEFKKRGYYIRALAREWASKKTMLAAGGLSGWGGACRSATGVQWARLMISLQAMQGLGKPGVNIWSTVQGAPCNTDFMFPGYAEGGISADPDNSAAGFRWGCRSARRPHRHRRSTLRGARWPMNAAPPPGPDQGPTPIPKHDTAHH